MTSPKSWFLGDYFFLLWCQPAALISPFPVQGDASFGFGFGFDHGSFFKFIFGVYYLSFYLEERDNFHLSSLSPVMGSDLIKSVYL